MGDCFVKKCRAGFASNESNALLEDYLVAFTTVLGQVLGIPIEDLETAGEYMKDHGALPLGFEEWFRKYGTDMSMRLSLAEFRENASDEFLDELDYYLMILKEDVGELDNEAVCSDLVASLTRLSKMLASESCLVWEDVPKPWDNGLQMKAAGRGAKYIEKVSIEFGGDFFRFRSIFWIAFITRKKMSPTSIGNVIKLSDIESKAFPLRGRGTAKRWMRWDILSFICLYF